MDAAQRRIERLKAQLVPATEIVPVEAHLTSAEVVRELVIRQQGADFKTNPNTVTVEEFKAMVGKEIGVSNYFAISQERVNAFADATGDHQWIHVDVERAKSESPFGGPIAHGFLTLSLFPVLVAEVMPKITGIKMGVNYGLNKLRFVNPVPIGASVRARVGLHEFSETPGGAQCILKITIEREGETKPSIVAEWVTRYYL